MGEASVEVAGPAEGQLLGEYRVEKCLAAGGFGSVFLASSVKLEGRKVIIKVIHLDDDGAKATLRHEAAQLVQLRHPSMVQVITFGEEPGFQYLVMEYIDGQTLADLMEKSGPLGAFEAVRVASKVAEALEAVHEAKVIHRDLKPANIMLRLSKDRGRFVDWLKLIDFGIAAAANAADAAPAGTPEYVAPETVRQQGERMTHATDLYALGCILFEMLTGRVPFQGATPLETVTLQAHGEIPHVSALVHGLPVELDALVVELLQKEPLRRPPSALAVTKALGKIERELSEGATGIRRLSSLQLPTTPPPPRAAEPTIRIERGPSTAQAVAAVRRLRWQGPALAVALLALAAIGWAVTRAPSRPVAVESVATAPPAPALAPPVTAPPPPLPTVAPVAAASVNPEPIAPPVAKPLAAKPQKAPAVIAKAPAARVEVTPTGCTPDADWKRASLLSVEEFSRIVAKKRPQLLEWASDRAIELSSAIAAASTRGDCAAVETKLAEFERGAKAP